MFDKIKELRKLQKQAKSIQKELEATHIEAEVDGVMVVINGKQEVQSVKIPDEMLTNGSKLEKSLEKAFNKALKTSQQVGAEKMKDVMGGLGLPGLGS